MSQRMDTRTGHRRSQRVLWLSGVTVAVGMIAVVAYSFVHSRVAEARYRQQTLAALSVGRVSQAREVATRWAKEHPGSAEAHFLLARAWLGEKSAQQAVEQLAEAQRLGYRAAELERLRALILVQAGRFPEAEPTLARIRASSEAKDPEIDRALARIYLETYRLGAAAAAIERWIADAPGDATPYLWRTEIHRRSGADPSELVKDYSAALARDPNLDEAWLGLAEALRTDHRYKDAANAFAEYLKRKPQDAAGLLGAARNAMSEGAVAEASGFLDQALVIQPKSPEILLERAGLRLRQGKPQEALDDLDRAIAVEPFDPDLHYRRSQALRQLGRVDEAKREQDRLAGLKADQERLAELRNGLVKNPNDVALKVEAARWLIDHGHGEEGVRWAKQVLRQEPSHPAMNQLLADYYARQGQPGLANYYRASARSDGAKR